MANTYTVNTTDTEDPLIAWIVAQYNTSHGTALSVQDYIQLRFPELLTPYVQAYQDAVSADLKTKYLSAAPSVQQQVKTLLGIS